MKQLVITRALMEASLTAQAILLPSGIQVSLSGGSLPHIGAVSIVDPVGICATTQFPGHKDGVVSERWAKALSNAGYRPAVVVAGIHYDNLSREQIASVVAMTDDMLSELLRALKETRTESPACR